MQQKMWYAPPCCISRLTSDQSILDLGRTDDVYKMAEDFKNEVITALDVCAPWKTGIHMVYTVVYTWYTPQLHLIFYTRFGPKNRFGSVGPHGLK